jgi:hypothetical protein
MRTSPSLETLARGARRSGWPIAVICGIALPFSFADPASLLCSAMGLWAGIEEIRRGNRLLGTKQPGATLRRLGWLQAAFTMSLLVYFGQKTVMLILGRHSGLIPGMDADTAAFMKAQAPELVQLEQSLTLFSTVLIGIVAVAWQAWWARRYFRASQRIGTTRYIGPAAFQPTLEQRAELERLARLEGVPETEILRRAFEQYAAGSTRPEEPPKL